MPLTYVFVPAGKTVPPVPALVVRLKQLYAKLAVMELLAFIVILVEAALKFPMGLVLPDQLTNL